MQIHAGLEPIDLLPAAGRVCEVAAQKVRALDRCWDPADGAPVFTIEGRYASRGWTEWTQGFQYGCALLAFDGTGERDLLEIGRARTVAHMASHVTHTGVHDHGFNNLSTYGNLRRLMREGRIDADEWELRFYEMALKASAAVQASRWSWCADRFVPTRAPRGAASSPPAEGPRLGYVHSFNGPHSLFIDTMRTLRILGLGHQLGHVLMEENDEKVSLLGRAVLHTLTTARFIVWYGEDRDAYDLRGRVAHEGVFNPKDGRFRCPSTQQGYSPFSTWTRGLAWAVLGFAEQLEFLTTLDSREVKAACGVAKSEVMRVLGRAARATGDHYIEDCSASDGVCYWDAGAPGLSAMPGWRREPADPYNDHEPVDASASAIAAQGLLRLGRHLGAKRGGRYVSAGLAIARTLFDAPYLATARRHQGLLLHSVYHRPNGWDHIPEGRNVPCGESSMWGDYHLLELAVMVRRLAGDGPYPVFFDA